MAASSAALLLLPLPLSGASAVRRVSVRCGVGPTSSPAPRKGLGSRRQCLLLLALSSAALPSPARSADIPLFGIRKRIEKIEEEAEEIVEEGEKALQKGLEAAEKEFQVAEEGIVASAGLGVAGNLLQAGAVAGAEAVGVIVAVSVVNGILAAER